jgi:sialidase-1
MLPRRFILFIAGLGAAASAQPVAPTSPLRKISDLVIYSDARFHAAFPSVVKRPDGSLFVAFRRAPDRVALGETQTTHVDAASQLVRVTSRDGQIWTPEPTLLFAHPLGGSQDPCLLALRDGTWLCASYAWALVRPEGEARLPRPNIVHEGGFVFLGGYLLRSNDAGETWRGPIDPPVLDGEIAHDPYGRVVPAYNRGALCEATDGRILWVAARHDAATPARTSTHLLTSTDKGTTWKYASAVASDPTVSFNEASVYQTPKGDIVVFLRTAGLDSHACLARSTDGGQTFAPWQDLGFQGYPLHALRLADQRVLLTYGYRATPYGIRARVLNAECTDAATAPEFILRSDGGTTDLGYPWSVQLDAHRVLVVYYFNVGQGPRHIAGTILALD